jgi:hypothetical protein
MLFVIREIPDLLWNRKWREQRKRRKVFYGASDGICGQAGNVLQAGITRLDQCQNRSIHRATTFFGCKPKIQNVVVVEPDDWEASAVIFNRGKAGNGNRYLV